MQKLHQAGVALPEPMGEDMVRMGRKALKDALERPEIASIG
jgi:hypothetical protein